MESGELKSGLHSLVGGIAGMPAAAATLPGISIEWRVRHADALCVLGEICRWAKSASSKNKKKKTRC